MTPGVAPGHEEAMTVVRRVSRRTAVAVLAALVVLVGAAVAIGSGGGGSASSVGSPATAEYAPSERMVGAPGADAAAGGVAADRAAVPEDPAPGVPVGVVQRSLVRSAALTVEVADPAAGARDVRAAAVAAGGFVAQEQSGRDTGWMVLRVPADALDRLTEQVSALGTVTERSTAVVDATEEVVDLDARVAGQQASVARVRALLAEATSIGDVVAIESELARREADLDSLTGRLAALRDQVALSTLTVELRGPESPPVGAAADAPGFLDGLAAGWAGLLALGTGVGALLGFVLPFVPVLAVVGGIAWAAARGVRRRRAAST
ncbi:DUF4349 domain-containing protein [Pseudonocardia hydrocarbonoxydans]|uniref:DUF4349 domain-containing protein n=1 Tax=Pseudonocardia hydrocarbonoxydans TaxID=76726 RepID=A0A4Y3WPN4_9PSEU|nr:DUF4349 domain-containing protein [Pseudonocardia hydrocarbonoxydans]GEC20827.1 hypothetical protein PHY01_31100 [Pseudonocardia hydrocarbonoxydans]